MEIIIDLGEIESDSEFFARFLPQLSAPKWHGRNLDALRDSIVTGDINGVEPPYNVICKNMDSVSPELRQFQFKIMEILREANEEGREIGVSVE